MLRTCGRADSPAAAYSLLPPSGEKQRSGPISAIRWYPVHCCVHPTDSFGLPPVSTSQDTKRPSVSGHSLRPLATPMAGSPSFKFSASRRLVGKRDKVAAQ